MPTPSFWRTWSRRIVSLGLPRLLLVLAMLFLLVALASPLWFLTEAEGNEWTTSTYSWAGWSSVSARDGVCCRTVSEPYNWPGFDQPRLAASLGNAYLLMVVYFVVLLAVAGLFSTGVGRRFPPLGLLLVAVFVVALAFLALFYPLATVPSAAAVDLQLAQITGFWGSATVGGPPLTSYAWGAGLGWWLLLVAVVLGVVGGAWPYLRALREPSRLPAAPWRPGR